MKKKYLIGILIFLIGIIGFVSPVKADIKNVSVTPIVDDNSAVSDRFELKVQPGDVKTVSISLTNFGNGTVTLVIDPTNAGTNQDGKFDFNNVARIGEYGLKQTFSSMTKRRTVTLRGQQTKDLEFTIKVPTTEFDGTVMGGFNIYTKGDKDTYTRQAGSVPVWITENDKFIQPNIKLTGISTHSFNTEPFIYAQLANDQPTAIRNLSVKATIQHRNLFGLLGFGNKVYKVNVDGYQIAPNSVLPLPFNFKTDAIKAGTYVVKGTASSGTKTWKFEGTYKISKEAADKTNKKAKNIVVDYTWVFILVILGLILLIVIVIVLIRQQMRYRRRH